MAALGIPPVVPEVNTYESGSAGLTSPVVGGFACGKSSIALALLQLMPPNGQITDGQLLFKGRDLMSSSQHELRQIRGHDMAMIFQDPMTSLNPVFTVGNQIVEAVKLHQNKSGPDAWAIAVEMMQKVGIADPERRVTEYPHQMSGGMRQRVMIAMALCCTPKLLIADEPTTALDVTIQAQILDLLRQLQRQENMSIMMITHDLGVVAETCDRVGVMYAGNLCEIAEVSDLFERPMHPYTKALMSAIPSLDPDHRGQAQKLEGEIPSPLAPPPGCKFQTRCPHAIDVCRTEEPHLEHLGLEHDVACHRWKQLAENLAPV